MKLCKEKHFCNNLLNIFIFGVIALFLVMMPHNNGYSDKESNVNRDDHNDRYNECPDEVCVRIQKTAAVNQNRKGHLCRYTATYALEYP